MHYRAALFDFDGTLTPSLPLWVRAFQIALRTHGVEMTQEEIAHRLFHRNWDASFHELDLPSREEFRAEVFRALPESFDQAELFPDVLDVLERCRAAGVQTALVTSAPRFILEHVEPRLRLQPAFDSIVSADDVKKFKPNPEPVFMALDALSRRPHEAIMIGDSTVDILAGKAAGTATALFLPSAEESLHPIEALRATEPDHVFARHEELVEILGL